jgi:hypothetical protein
MEQNADGRSLRQLFSSLDSVSNKELTVAEKFRRPGRHAAHPAPPAAATSASLLRFLLGLLARMLWCARSTPVADGAFPAPARAAVARPRCCALAASISWASL